MNIATLVYPGGSLADKDSVGFDWTKNFISNLFAEKTVNGLNNPAQIWADAGMIFISGNFAVLYYLFFKENTSKGGRQHHQVPGSRKPAVYFFNRNTIARPNGDDREHLIFGKFISHYCFHSKVRVALVKIPLHHLPSYFLLYLIPLWIRPLWRLPIMQKLTFICSIVLILGLEYFTEKGDFVPIKIAKSEK